MNAGSKNTPSTHHPRRRNVTTLMVGLKTVTYAKISPKSGDPQRYSWERKNKPKKNKQKKNIDTYTICRSRKRGICRRLLRHLPTQNGGQHYGLAIRCSTFGDQPSASKEPTLRDWRSPHPTTGGQEEERRAKATGLESTASTCTVFILQWSAEGVGDKKNHIHRKTPQGNVEVAFRKETHVK